MHHWKKLLKKSPETNLTLYKSIINDHNYLLNSMFNKGYYNINEIYNTAIYNTKPIQQSFQNQTYQL